MGTAGILCKINNTIFYLLKLQLCLFLHREAVSSLSRVVIVASADAPYLSSGLLSSSLLLSLLCVSLLLQCI